MRVGKWLKAQMRDQELQRAFPWAFWSSIAGLFFYFYMGSALPANIFDVASVVVPYMDSLLIAVFVFVIYMAIAHTVLIRSFAIMRTPPVSKKGIAHRLFWQWLYFLTGALAPCASPAAGAGPEYLTATIAVNTGIVLFIMLLSFKPPLWPQQ